MATEHYAYESDPDLLFADIHEDGIFSGDWRRKRDWRRCRRGRKLNLPMLPGATDADFVTAWARIEEYLRGPARSSSCSSADSLERPITRWRSARRAHARASASVCRIADELGHGRVLGMGGGGYSRRNLASLDPCGGSRFVAS